MQSRRIMVAVTLVAIAASGCGSSSKSGTSTTSPTTTGSQSTAGSGTPTTKAFSGSSGNDFCGLVNSYRSAIAGPNFAGKAPADLKSIYQNLGSALDRAVSVAPGAIKPDFQTLANAYKPVLKAFADANYDITRIPPSDYRTFATAFSNPQIKTASAHIEQYVVQVCHVTPTT
jgi:hypothetical protein